MASNFFLQQMETSLADGDLLWQSLAQATVRTAPEMNYQDVANCLYGLAKVGFSHSDAERLMHMS